MLGLLNSRKFIYAITTLIVSVIYAVVPMALDLDADGLAMLNEWLPVTASVIIMAVFGHILQDYTATKNNVQILPLDDAAHGVIDAVAEGLPLAERDENA